MNVDQPYLLLGLLAIPVLLAAYLWQTRRRKPVAVRHSNVALVRTAVGPSRRWRRHVPVALVLASLALLGVAAARPQVRADVPVSSSTVILALDVSGSMCATDVEPNRLRAAQAAVRKFVETQDDDTKIGLVLFSGFAQLAVAPTTNKADLLSTLDAVTTGRGTTIGAAILKSLDAIAELDPNVAPSTPEDAPNPDGSSLPRSPESGDGRRLPPRPRTPAATRLPRSSCSSPTARTRGASPPRTPHSRPPRAVCGSTPSGSGRRTRPRWSARSSQLGGLNQQRFGGGRDFGGGVTPGGGRNFLVVDEDALKTVASTTGGEYFAATDADQLQSVLADLPKHVTDPDSRTSTSAPGSSRRRPCSC